VYSSKTYEPLVSHVAPVLKRSPTFAIDIP
jgi:hypothetical protein